MKENLIAQPMYSTNYGKAYLGDSNDLFKIIPDSSIDLVITSPPFALQRKKEYGNKEQDEYIDWLFQFSKPIMRVLKDTGSFVLDMGGAYQKNKPVRSLYNYRVLIKFCDEAGFNLAEEFFWHNPAKLPSPIEWVNKRKIRVKDSVNTVWWFSKTENPKANVRNVLAPYSKRMKKLLSDAENYYKPKLRPSGHDISDRFNHSNGGAIPSNLLQISNTESNSQYLRACKDVGVDPHPARFPSKLPEFFIKFLTDPNDVVLDFFAGSNTTGAVAENLERKWIAFEKEPLYLAASSFRFIDISEKNQESAKIFNELLDTKNGNILLPQIRQTKLLEAERSEQVGDGQRRSARLGEEESKAIC
ncbi:MAG: site-specific DNA-methyltransferase [Euryarchaeota archaeon]|nr:site-specific DNA-methyltransferase [Euryarchaeota archaeon]